MFSKFFSGSGVFINGNFVGGGVGNGFGIVGNGNVISKDLTHIITVKLKEINVQGIIDVQLEIDHSVKNSLVLSVEENLAELIEVKYNSMGVLTLSINGSFTSNRGIKVVIKSNTLSKITRSGSGDIRGYVANEDLTIRADGSGDISLKGVTNSLYVEKSGSGDLSLSELKAAHVLLKSHGSGDISCYASMSFSGTTSGSGDVDVYGGPLKTDTKSSGSGDLTIH
jgi:hypothetical protein